MPRRILALAACTLALYGATFLFPATGHAADLGFPYYGGLTNGDAPLLPCTGFFQFGGEAVVSDVALNGLPQCTNVCQVFEFANRLIVLAVSIMVTIVAPIFIFVGAFLIFTSGGDPGKRQQAGRILQGVLVGIVLVLCATLIVNQLLFIIFNRAFGEEIRDRLKAQPGTGVTAAEADDLFGWNDISCTVIAGGVEFTPYSTKKAAPASNGTPPDDTPPIIVPPRQDPPIRGGSDFPVLISP